MYEFQIPFVGENIKSGTVVSIAVSVGSAVKKDQDLLELETDKATIPVPSPVTGVIKELLIKEGDEVNVGQVVMRLDAEVKASTGMTSTAAKPAAAPKSAPVKSAAATTTKAPARASTLAPVASSTPRFSNEAIPPQNDVPAAPSIRRLARELGLMLSQVRGSGPGGRVSKDDVKSAAKGIILATQFGTPQSKEFPSEPLPDFAKWGAVERKPMNNIRKKTATHLAHAWQVIAHVTQFDKADITELEKIRKAKSTDERKLTITPFLLKIMAAALKQFPQFNSSIDMDTKEVIYKNYFHLGVAVDTDRGLLVPVIRDIDKKNIFELTSELNQAAERARTKKTGLDELQGGSMTLTNLGGIGGTMFTPIVNWPEVAILGVSRGAFEPIYDAKSGQFNPRFRLPLSLSYDHRIIDGADGARFLRWICEALEKPNEFKF